MEFKEISLNTWVSAILAISIGLVVIRSLRSCTKWFCQRAELPYSLARPFENLIRYVLTIVIIAIILQTWGVDLRGLWSTLTAICAMIAVGFIAAWSVLSNVLCGLLIVVLRPFRVGDRIAFAGESTAGQVTDIRLFYTILLTEKNTRMIVPNNMIFQKVLDVSKANESSL